MRAVVQRVSKAEVTVGEETIGAIGNGLLVLLAVAPEDGGEEVAYMIRKLSGLRIFPDDAGLMNRSIADAGGSFLVVSQFTLYGDVARGNRPSFTKAACGEHAEALYTQVCSGLKAVGFDVQTGVFGAHMEVCLVNDGPVTIIIDTGARTG